MSIQKESYYKLVKINDLSTVNRNTFIQIIGNITVFDEKNHKVVIDDGFGKHTIEIGSNVNIPFRIGQVIRVFGNWDGIKISIDQILEWSIDPNKITLLFQGLN